MLWTIFVVLMILWLLGSSFSLGGQLIHILLVIALIVLGYNLLTGRRGQGSAVTKERRRITRGGFGRLVKQGRLAAWDRGPGGKGNSPWQTAVSLRPIIALRSIPRFADRSKR